MSKKVRVKPGKGQSMMGFIVGILFCLIGVFVVIPSAGLFGVFWTLMALIITITNAMNAFTDKGVTSHEIIIDDGEESIESRLRAGEELYNAGMITEAEYEEKRKEILKDL